MTTHTISKQILLKIKLRKLSINDLVKWEYEFGESFIHYYGSLIDFKIFSGFFLSKEPSLNEEIFTLINLNSNDIQEFSSILELKYPSNDLTLTQLENLKETYNVNSEFEFKLKQYFIEFVNLTNFTRKKIIYILDNNISHNLELKD